MNSISPVYIYFLFIFLTIKYKVNFVNFEIKEKLSCENADQIIKSRERETVGEALI